MLHLNPYIAGDPIRSEQKFFGREDVFRNVKHVLQNPHSNAIVLYGQRRIGKTSVLLQLENRLLREGEFTPVYFDLQDKASKPLSTLLYDLAVSISRVIGTDIPLPELFDEYGDYFRKEFLPSAASSISKGGLVLLFDEFDVLDSASREQAGQSFFPYLRQWMSEISLVRFVFVIGRRPEDLSTDTHSTFKSIRATRVSRLDRTSAEAMIRQSEEDRSLIWSDDAVEKLWELCQGHSFFTQLMCSVIFEKIFDSEPTDIPEVQRAHVEESISEAFNQGANAFHWVWGGLPPAERIVIAAMAEIEKDLITQEELIERLNQSGVRLIVRELELAPETLAEWEILNQSDDGYSFTVPLFKRWAAKNRPLKRVKDELDRLDPLADGLFQTGQRYYNIGQVGEAENQLRRSLEINPNHLKSKLLLGRVLVEDGRAEEASTVLEEAYLYDQSATRAELVKALLALAGNSDQEEQNRIRIYERVLQIDKSQPIARERLGQILHDRRLRELQARANSAEEREREKDWQAAIHIYRELLAEVPDNAEWHSRLSTAIEGDIATRISLAELHEVREEWPQAAEIYSDLMSQYPNEGDWSSQLQRVQGQEHITAIYRQALGALETGDSTTAMSLLAEVVHKQPDFKEAARFLLVAVTGVDVEKLQQTLRDFEKYKGVNIDDLQGRLKRLEEYKKMYVDEHKSRYEFVEYFKNDNPESLIACPNCHVNLKAKNLPRHLIQKHSKSELANYFKTDNPDAILDCPVCKVKLKAKNLPRHFTQKHTVKEP